MSKENGFQPMLTYGAETLTLTKQTIKHFRVAQYAMQQSNTRIILNGCNGIIRRRTGLQDAIQTIYSLAKMELGRKYR